MKRFLKRLLLVALVAVFAVACGGSPTAPSAPTPTMAEFHIQISANCIGKVSAADVYLDGLYVGSPSSGGDGIHKTVNIGDHTVEAYSYYSTGYVAYHWGPLTKIDKNCSRGRRY